MQLLAEELSVISQQDEAWSLWRLIGENLAILWKDWPKDMQVTGLDNKTSFSFSGVCPHCVRPTVFIQVTNVAQRDPQEYSNHIFHTEMAAVLCCQGCLKYILGIARHIKDGRGVVKYTYDAHYPVGHPNDAVEREIPVHIASDFKEALRCLYVNAYNATAEMCRRAIEASCIDLGAPASERFLDNKIDWLESQRKITPFLRDVAHKIRLGGNRAAHPGNVTPANGTTQSLTPEPTIEKEHAEAIVKFTHEFFHHVYVVPKQLDKYDFSKPKASAAAVKNP